MYEYLIRDLRDPNKPIDCNEVAGAIEKLNRIIYLLESDRDAERELRLYAEENTPRWISVTKRLPEERINPNTQDFEYVLCTTIWGDVRPFKYGTPIGQKDAHFWNGAGYVDAYVTHWQPLPTPPKEEI